MSLEESDYVFMGFISKWLLVSKFLCVQDVFVAGGLGWGEEVMGRYVGVYHVDVNDRIR